ncbi:MAG: PmoA family protein, partial [Bacteroidales bacterium]|nr:PmoA family protein [Bacteroidales bacterium]
MKFHPLVILLGLSMCSSTHAQDLDSISLNVQKHQDRVEVLVNGELFTAYRFEATLEKPILFPVHAPDGTIVTRGYPLAPRGKERVDHPHHVGLWLNFGDVNGYDFWNNSS